MQESQCTNCTLEVSHINPNSSCFISCADVEKGQGGNERQQPAPPCCSCSNHILVRCHSLFAGSPDSFFTLSSLTMTFLKHCFLSKNTPTRQFIADLCFPNNIFSPLSVLVIHMSQWLSITSSMISIARGREFRGFEVIDAPSARSVSNRCSNNNNQFREQNGIMIKTVKADLYVMPVPSLFAFSS